MCATDTSERQIALMHFLIRMLCLVLYYAIARWLPFSGIVGGKLWRKARLFVCKPLFASCGRDVNIERGAFADLVEISASVTILVSESTLP